MYGHWYKHTSRYNPKVQCAFKISMTHWILQFALRIAVRSVLHRCASLDIHCWKLLWIKTKNFRSRSIVSVLSKWVWKVHRYSRDTQRAKQPDLRLAIPKESTKHNYNGSRGKFFWCGNDPSAGSPTETLLRLHLPLNGEVRKSSHEFIRNEANGSTVPISHRVIQSVGATGGVYKGQGRNQCKLMTCVY